MWVTRTKKLALARSKKIITVVRITFVLHYQLLQFLTDAC
ncbi:hypothetical protein [Vibrio parahaemolyticus RIMD 2210633]|uniref:Uncharacterized protein n=1 Tax=Vibrio parahaemolyticus serotype O3:K6 (strain RIMD 2210633) TaxID=223926 RepID=Q87PC6_VIBPA|nr:hypothetical protein [Vibrio parahaemolyticus RIMD 2210633]